jgi:RNA polymerase sigma-70 factor (ECF subfamily)
LIEHDPRTRIEQAVLPHLDAAYNLARWLTGNEHDASDVTQEACLRAVKFFDGFRGGDSRTWILKIVRNTCSTWRQRNQAQSTAVPFDEETHAPSDAQTAPDAELLSRADRELVREALDALPPEHREVIVLREFEEMSYKQIAAVVNVPLGTVMSRLDRARTRLESYLANRLREEP